jgi:hypothetical protein
MPQGPSSRCETRRLPVGQRAATGDFKPCRPSEKASKKFGYGMSRGRLSGHTPHARTTNDPRHRRYASVWDAIADTPTSRQPPRTRRPHAEDRGHRDGKRRTRAGRHSPGITQPRMNDLREAACRGSRWTHWSISRRPSGAASCRAHYRVKPCKPARIWEGLTRSPTAADVGQRNSFSHLAFAGRKPVSTNHEDEHPPHPLHPRSPARGRLRHLDRLRRRGRRCQYQRLPGVLDALFAAGG